MMALRLDASHGVTISLNTTVSVPYRRLFRPSRMSNSKAPYKLRSCISIAMVCSKLPDQYRGGG